ncbi:unnamed protein product [Rotaria sp. Silwood2]|nr:unnamed protein product [Rotaria sp. Silwood2]CAF2625746.1 unnamed protein product [Rotaria sp. Silwood2]CAF3018093.1 unnamed protein product [Rotaria sp. Silwood2]CAF4491758.1 unnamed protein product [Rotaria sp. Silwood2]CAF4521283.1 unnamed protein product [Rotaria sp. Silwood2]
MASTNEVGLAPDRVRNQSGDISEDLHCSICHNILWKSVACQTCETHYCSVCIKKWLHEGRNQCPVGCEPFVERACSRFIVTPLAKLQVTCTYEPNGCREILPYEAVEKHEVECGFQAQRCAGCHSSFAKKEIEQHKSQCPLIEITCEDCKIVYKKGDASQSHTDMICLKEQFGQFRHQTQEENIQLKEDNQQLKEEIKFLKEELQKHLQAPQSQSTTSARKTPLSSSENIKFAFTDIDKQQTQLQKQTLITKAKTSSVESSSSASNALSEYDSKPSIFGNLNGTSNTSLFGTSTPINNPNSSIFGGSASIRPPANTSGFSFSGFGNTTAKTPTNGFQFSTPGAASTSTTNISSTLSFGSALAAVTANKPIFGNTPKFNFSDFAKQSSTSMNDKSTSNGTEQRVFAGQGSLMFGTNTTVKTNTNEDDEGDGDGEDESYEPNVSFKPIVQLSAVEVKTGEEDENILFCEHAKLYRFDGESNQMKERGIGEIKILQHKTKNLHRILMRREQVLKLCANHKITSQMKLRPHQGSENAYVWSAMDFADGEAKHETLCVRFKSSDIAKRFVKQFNEAKQANVNTQ